MHVECSALFRSDGLIDPLPEAGDSGVDIGRTGSTGPTSPWREASQNKLIVLLTNKGTSTVTLQIKKLRCNDKVNDNDNENYESRHAKTLSPWLSIERTAKTLIRLGWAYRSFCWFCHATAHFVINMSPDMTKWVCAQRRLRSASWLSAWRKLGSLATHWAHSEDSGQTRRLYRFICWIMTIRLSNLWPGLAWLARMSTLYDITRWAWTLSLFMNNHASCLQ